MIKVPFLYLIPVSIIFLLSGCVASSNYHSARTLEANKFAVSFSADDILMKSSESSSTQVGISKDLPFAPALGFSYGLPLRLEAGIRWYPTRFLEFTMRDQINPRSFQLFDFSIDLSYAGQLDAYSYIKYGATLSKNINEFEPYIHYSFYAIAKKIKNETGGTIEGFISNLSNDIINNTNTLGFGFGIPFKKIKLYPEADYQYLYNDFSKGIWHVGVGLRIYTN